MTPKQKALEIYMKFYGIPLYVKTLKECCHILVDELIKQCSDANSLYWEEVKREIDLIK
jgi:hypothetical protein